MSVPSNTTVAPEEAVRELLASERVRRAFRFFETRAEWINEEHAAICAVPSPPFGEAERAEYLRAKFVESGLAGRDSTGRVTAWRCGRGRNERPTARRERAPRPVFPAGRISAVRREGLASRARQSPTRCGLAALIALVRALDEFEIETEGSLLFVGTWR